MHTAAREFFRGVGDLGRGFGFWVGSPRLMLLGAVPALIVGTIWAALLVLLLVSIDRVATALTPFAAGWGEPWRSGAALVVGFVVVIAAFGVAVLSFTAVVLTVGDPFYERISTAVERRLGDQPAEHDEPLLRGVLRAAGEGLRLLLASALVGLLVVLLGLIPLVGAPLAAAVGAVIGGWFLALELTGHPFEARGLALRDRRRALAGHRARTLGFGVATWLVFLIPFGAVVAMPAAVSGATVLARAALPGAAVSRPGARGDAADGGAARPASR